MKLCYFILISLYILQIKVQSSESVRYIRQTLRILARKLDSVIEETVTNTECAKDLRMLMSDLIRRKKWAVQMIDATAKIEPGLLIGNMHQMGNYDECLAIREQTDNSTIQGQYCTLVISPKNEDDPSIHFNGFSDPLSLAGFISAKAVKFLRIHKQFMKFMHGLCLPASCTVQNMQSIWKYIEPSVPAIKVEFMDILCVHKGKSPFYIGIEPLIFLAFIFYFTILAAATVYEIFFFNGDEENVRSFICALSIRRNAKKIFSTNVGEDNISCINGLKVLSMCWIIIGHRYLVNAFTPNINTSYLLDWKENIESMAILGATVSVDTFLAISGLLISYIYLRYTQLKNMKVNMISFYMLRIARLTPPLIAVILIYIAVLKYVNDGPLWPIISGKLARDCVYHGWANLLFVNNFIQLNNQCVPQSWYLSVDSQLYFIFPLMFFSVTKNPRKTFHVMLAIGLISIAASFLITIHYGITSTIFDTSYADNVYQSSFLRMPVWLIGVATGYFIFKYKDTNLVIPRNLSTIFWISTLIILNTIVFGQIIVNRNENSYLSSAIFNSLGRPLWSLSICWIIFACATNNADKLNSFLSLPIFNCVAKITYSLFLVHFMVILIIAGRRKHVDHFNNIRAIHEFCGDAVFSVVIAFCFSLLFESPIITLAKKFFNRFEEVLREDQENSHEVVVKYIMWFIPVKVHNHSKVE